MECAPLNDTLYSIVAVSLLDSDEMPRDSKKPTLHEYRLNNVSDLI